MLILIVAAPACRTTRLADGVPNFAVVDDGIYRSGQPTPDGWKYLAAMGITNVIKLNPESDSSDAPARALGMAVYNQPISLYQLLFGPINARQLQSTVEEIKPGTLIHCQHGQDRTGLAIAMYRVQTCGWTKQKAEEEMLANGFHKELLGLWHCWQTFQPSP
jgi:protein tyrosine phosphatase (PTP) superfamily phosphohydrolase (DUF442 family)